MDDAPFLHFILRDFSGRYILFVLRQRDPGDQHKRGRLQNQRHRTAHAVSVFQHPDHRHTASFELLLDALYVQQYPTFAGDSARDEF